MVTQIELSMGLGIGGIALGFTVGYAMKKIVKIIAVIVGVFVAALAYLSYQNIISVNNDRLVELSQHIVNTVNQTATNVMQQAPQHLSNGSVVMPGVVGIGGFLLGVAIGWQKG